jgi:hypothetical protein
MFRLAEAATSPAFPRATIAACKSAARSVMEYDKEKVDEVVLALLYLTMFEDKPGRRAWKSHDWDAMDRLHEKGYISDPKSKAKSVVMTEEGAKRAQELFEKHFMTPDRRARQR